MPKGGVWRLVALARVPLVRRSLQRLGSAGCSCGGAGYDRDIPCERLFLGREMPVLWLTAGSRLSLCALPCLVPPCLADAFSGNRGICHAFCAVGKSRTLSRKACTLGGVSPGNFLPDSAQTSTAQQASSVVMLVSVCAELPQLIAIAGDASEKSLCAPGMPWPRLPVSGRM